MGAVRMMEQPQVMPLQQQQQAPPSTGAAVAPETQGRLGSRAASNNTTGSWRTGWPALPCMPPVNLLLDGWALNSCKQWCHWMSCLMGLASSCPCQTAKSGTWAASPGHQGSYAAPFVVSEATIPGQLTQSCS